MNKKIAAVVCLALLTSATSVFAADYVSGDARYDAPDFEKQTEQYEAENVKRTPKTVNKKTEDGTVKEVMPITLTGDSASYDSVSGDFSAAGNVKIVQGTQTLLTTKVTGNMKTGDVWLKEGGTIIEPLTKVDGDWLYYNFNDKTGEIKQIEGKSKKDCFRAPHAEITPDMMVLDEGGEMTRCPAVKHSPCLLVKADRFEIYPHDKMVAYNVKVFVKGKHVYSRDRWVNYLNDDNATRIMPRIGFNDNDNGAYIKVRLNHNVNDKLALQADLPYYTKAHFKPLLSAKQDERNFAVELQNGWVEKDDEWIKKQTDVTLRYKNHHISDSLPLSYSAYASHGLWTNDRTKVKSWHTEYAAYLNHDRIYLFGGQDTFLDLTIGKKWVKESYTDEMRSTTAYYATLGQKLTDKWNTWVGYYNEKITTNLYDYGQPDMNTELRNGIQYQADDKNTFSIVNRYDLDQKQNYETDYKWQHRFCCWVISFEYQHENFTNGGDSFKVKYEFLNW